jgi:Ca-activated chloride channel homolog
MFEFINNSWWPLSLASVVLFALCWYWSEKKRTKTLRALMSEEMNQKLTSSACNLKRTWRNILFTAAWACLALAALRPFSGFDTEERQQSSKDVMLVLDTSNSMNVMDCYGESRLNYGKSLIRKLVDRFPADRFGVMSFAGLAFLECPMTSDSYSINQALSEMDSSKIPLGGTNFEVALSRAMD